MRRLTIADTRRILPLVVLLMIACHGHAGEVYVSAAAKAPGNGHVDAPFPTLAQAIRAAKPGDTVTVAGGIYCERIVLTSGLTLRAAEGERVVISGFAPITGWQLHHDQVYTTTIDWDANDLFVGYSPQRLSRYPNADAPWLTLDSVDGEAKTFVSAAMKANARLADVAKKPGATFAFVLQKQGNYFTSFPIGGIDLEAAALALDWKGKVAAQAGDRYVLVGHEALIDQPGEWSYQRLDDKTTRLYFWPNDVSDLERTQSRHLSGALVTLGHWKDQQAAIRIEGIEITGGRRQGISVANAHDVSIERCIIHHNGNQGIMARPSADTTIRRNIVVANEYGITIASSRNVLIEQNEVAFNAIDGIVIAGDISGNGSNDPTRDVVVRRNYVHHHLFYMHPDNFQAYRGVTNLTLENNLGLWSGQGIMTQETEQSAFTGNVFFGAEAVAVIFGHGNSSRWTLTNNTIGFGGWGAVAMSGEDYAFHRNILFENPIKTGKDYVGDYNVVWPGRDDWAFAITTSPWTSHADPASFAQATGQDAHSLRADPKLRNVPVCQVVLDDLTRSTANRLFVRGQYGPAKATRGFAVGDHIEINGDSVVRRVVNLDDESLTFEPPLPTRPFRIAMVWNWKDRTDFRLDTRPTTDSPAQSLGDDTLHAGADIDVQAYIGGDFDADGQRDLPAWPVDVRAAQPDPNAPVLPFVGLP